MKAVKMSDTLHTTTMLFVSVVIPTRDRNEQLSLCLDRLKPGFQSLGAADYEVIVSDDGRESTAQDMMRDRYPWARWVAGPRRGPAANRNNGARHARGAWIVLTDDDCLPEPGWLAAYVAAVRPDVQVLEGRTTCQAGIHSPLHHAPINLTGGWLWSCNIAVRRSTYEELGGFDEEYPYTHMEDVDFRERLGDAGIRFEYVLEATVDHPPRRLPRGRELAAAQESYIIYCRKRGMKIGLLSLLWIVIQARLRTLIRYPFSRDTLVAAVSLVEELLVLSWRFSKWKRRHIAPLRLQACKASATSASLEAAGPATTTR